MKKSKSGMDSFHGFKKTLTNLIFGGALIFGGTQPSKAALTDWIYNPQTKNEYRLSDPGTWEQAQTEAESYGGYLTAINNRGENEWITENLASIDSGAEQIWIGLSYNNLDGQWNWSNGDPLVYTNWDEPVEPSNPGTENWGAMNNINNTRPIGTWNDIRNYVQPGIIERVPEPSTIALLGLGGLGLTFSRKKEIKKK